ADLAASDNFDLIVVGHRGRGGVTRVLLGSVADRLLQISPRPVLVAR
ncbi:MAG: universal stress protein, partial [Myxococcales bacterium]